MLDDMAQRRQAEIRSIKTDAAPAVGCAALLPDPHALVGSPPGVRQGLPHLALRQQRLCIRRDGQHAQSGRLRGWERRRGPGLEHRDPQSAPAIPEQAGEAGRKGEASDATTNHQHIG